MDDATTLAEALKRKRREDLNLTAPEAGQLLEFAAENQDKFPRLALYMSLLLTDDLTHLEDPALWQQQKEIVLATEKILGVDAGGLWEEIDRSETPAPAAANPGPTQAETTAPPQEAKRQSMPPPPPVRIKKTRHGKKQRGLTGGSPPRWALAVGFLLLLTMMSCGVCVLSWF